MSKEDPNTLDYTTPLFIQHRLLLKGHSKNTLNATGTFVRFQGKHYIVTCRHVLKKADHSNHFNLAIMIDRTVINLSTMSGAGPAYSSFKVPLDESGKHEIDVCISPIDHAWEYIIQAKGKKAVDLDLWIVPDWANISEVFACGWLNKKDHAADMVSTSGVHIYVESSSKISPNNRQFTLHSATGNPDWPSLSGISGGLIHTKAEQGEIPFGIVFEGYPGDEPADALLKPGDLMVRGHVLTPQIFKGWLAAAKA
jgi:hypothetical protein